MTSFQPLAATLSQMPTLAELFRIFLSGKHLNRMAEPALWAELEKHEASYVGLFAALGFELRLDARGFAWFHSGDANRNIGKISRQLALLFMVMAMPTTTALVSWVSSTLPTASMQTAPCASDALKATSRVAT